MSLEDSEYQFTTDTIFRKYDINRKQKLGEIEVSLLLKDALKQTGSKENVTREKVKLFISKIDLDGDSKISKDEPFKALKQRKYFDFISWFFLS